MLCLAPLLVFGDEPPAKSVEVKHADVPYLRAFDMKAGEAMTFTLPDGKTIAVWCKKSPGFAEQTTNNGLKTQWGEQPFKQVELKWTTKPDGSVEVDGWDSYIKQGAVISRFSERRKVEHDEWSEYYLFEGKWQFTIIENLDAEGAELTVRISVLPVRKDGEEVEVDQSRFDWSKADHPPRKAPTTAPRK